MQQCIFYPAQGALDASSSPIRLPQGSQFEPTSNNESASNSHLLSSMPHISMQGSLTIEIHILSSTTTFVAN